MAVLKGVEVAKWYPVQLSWEKIADVAQVAPLFCALSYVGPRPSSEGGITSPDGYAKIEAQRRYTMGHLQILQWFVGWILTHPGIEPRGEIFVHKNSKDSSPPFISLGLYIQVATATAKTAGFLK
jgi:hypothetical protein